MTIAPSGGGGENHSSESVLTKLPRPYRPFDKLPDSFSYNFSLRDQQARKEENVL